MGLKNKSYVIVSYNMEKADVSTGVIECGKVSFRSKTEKVSKSTNVREL